MDRCALFVDAGYVLADGALAVHGTQHRESVSWDYGGLLQLLGNLAMGQSGLPLLRCYWYERAADGRRNDEQDALADMPGVKLRLAKADSGYDGVTGVMHRDLTALARNQAVSDAMVVSSSEELTGVVGDVQDLGMRVTLLHIAADGNWTISRTLRQECDDIVEISPAHLRPYVELITGAEPVRPDQRPRGTQVAVRPHLNGNASGVRTTGYAPLPQAGLRSGNGQGRLGSPPTLYVNPPASERPRPVPRVAPPVPQMGQTPPPPAAPLSPMVSLPAASGPAKPASAPDSTPVPASAPASDPAPAPAEANAAQSEASASSQPEASASAPAQPETPAPAQPDTAGETAAPAGPSGSPGSDSGSGRPENEQQVSEQPAPAEASAQATGPQVPQAAGPQSGGQPAVSHPQSGPQPVPEAPGAPSAPAPAPAPAPPANDLLAGLAAMPVKQSEPPAAPAAPSAPAAPAPAAPQPQSQAPAGPAPAAPGTERGIVLGALGATIPAAAGAASGAQTREAETPRPEPQAGQAPPAPAQERPASQGNAAGHNAPPAASANSAPQAPGAPSAPQAPAFDDLPPAPAPRPRSHPNRRPELPIRREFTAFQDLFAAPVSEVPPAPAPQAAPESEAPEPPAPQQPQAAQSAPPAAGPSSDRPQPSEPSEHQQATAREPVSGPQPTAGVYQGQAPDPGYVAPATGQYAQQPAPEAPAPQAGHNGSYSGPQPAVSMTHTTGPGPVAPDTAFPGDQGAPTAATPAPGPEAPAADGQPAPWQTGPGQAVTSQPGTAQPPVNGGGYAPAPVPPASGQAAPAQPAQPAYGQQPYGQSQYAQQPGYPQPDYSQQYGQPGYAQDTPANHAGPATGAPVGQSEPGPRPAAEPAYPASQPGQGAPSAPANQTGYADQPGPVNGGQSSPAGTQQYASNPATQVPQGAHHAGYGPPSGAGVPPVNPVNADAALQGVAAFAPGVPQPAISLADAVQSAHEEGQEFGGSVARDAPALWLEAVLARKPRMPSDLEARLLQGSSLPIDFLLHDEVRHALRRGFWDALERARR